MAEWGLACSKSIPNERKGITVSLHSRRLMRQRQSRPVVVTTLASFVCILVATFAIACMSTVGVALSWLSDLPEYKDADSYAVAEPTQVFDARGNVIATFYLQNRRSVALSEISEYVKEATVDTEDIRFYSHNGVDPKGIVRAVIGQLRGNSQGASTITQQLVRNTVLSDEQFEQTLRRKVREAYIATEIEKSFSKDQILEMYLNTIYYGHEAYGIEAAAVTYLDKHASDLTLSEAAMLSGLPQSPSRYDPFSNMEGAINRRNAVLGRMVVAGDITQEEADTAMEEEIELHEGSLGNDPVGKYPFITEYIKEYLLRSYEMSTIFQGGLRIYTTIDPDQQQAAEEAVATVMDGIGDDDLEAAFVAVDPRNGHLLAMVGGRDYNKNQFNLATQARRQVGSSFKAFTLAASIKEGVNPNIRIDCSSSYEVDSNWTVHNISNANYGKITIAEATEKSSNTGYVRLEEGIGIQAIQDVATSLGISRDALPDDLTMTLGTGGIPPIDMAEAYATFANGGTHHEVSCVTRIENSKGTALFEEDTSGEQAISPEVAHATTEVLKGVVERGTATTVKDITRGRVNQPIAGKTGTTEDFRDLWFCGYTPQVSCSCWVGYREERHIIINGDDGHPSGTACPIVAEFLNRTLDGTDREDFPNADKPEYKKESFWDFSEGLYDPEAEAAAKAAREAEEAAKREREEEERRQQEEEENKAKEEARKAEEEAKRRAAEEAKKAEEEAKKKRAEEEAKKKAEEEAKRRAEEEAKEPAPEPTPEPEPAPEEGGDENGE